MQAHQISVSSPVFCTFFGDPSTKRYRLGLGFLQPINCSSLRSRKTGFLHLDGCKLRFSAGRWSFPRQGLRKDGILMREGKGNVVVAHANGGFGFNEGGGGGWGNSNTRRVLGNLALAIGLTYLSMTGQLGWLLDAVVSIWLIAVLLPILGIGAFLWFAGRDMVQDSCPNCGNEFQILKSSLKDGVQLCPFCSQPFSVQDNRFLRESTRFSSNRSSPFGQVFNGFSPISGKEKATSATVVDIEAEVKDID